MMKAPRLLGIVVSPCNAKPLRSAAAALLMLMLSGVPGLPSPEAIKNFLEYDIKIPMQIKQDVPPDRLLSLQFVDEVKNKLKRHRGDNGNDNRE